MNIYVGNLAYAVTEDELREAFSEFGTVDTINLITDKFTGQSKGFGFVEMANQAEAENAIKAMDGAMVQGRAIKVNEARPKTPRPNQRPR